MLGFCLLLSFHFQAFAGNPSVTISSTTDINCRGALTGVVNITVSGGTSPYTYHWSNGATTQNISGLAAGTYGITVTDHSSKTATTSATLAQPAAVLSCSNSGYNINCRGASTRAISISPAGGTSPYTYNWSNSSTIQNINNLAAGSYTVTVTDDNGCTTTSSVTLTQPLTAVSGSIVATNITTCNGASTRCGKPYSFRRHFTLYLFLEQWNYCSRLEQCCRWQLYRNCNRSQFMYNNNLHNYNSAPTAVTPSIVGTDVNCNGGSTGAADLTVTGGTLPYTYHWSNAATTQDLASKPAGTYSVTVTDNHSCTATSSVTITQPAVLSGSIVGTNIIL